MTDSSYTHIAVVLDRSGSMHSIRKDMEGGLNEFFKSQAELPGKCLVDFAQFDQEYDVVYTDKEVSEAKAVLEPRGGTALLDAIGKTVVTFGEKLAALKESERPGKVLVVIVTDGQENSSVDWNRSALKALVEKQTNEFNWEFVFLGANMDAVAEAGSFGIRAGSALTYDTTNTGETISTLSGYASSYRSTGQASFTDEDRLAAVRS